MGAFLLDMLGAVAAGRGGRKTCFMDGTLRTIQLSLRSGRAGQPRPPFIGRLAWHRLLGGTADQRAEDAQLPVQAAIAQGIHLRLEAAAELPEELSVGT